MNLELPSSPRSALLTHWGLLNLKVNPPFVRWKQVALARKGSSKEFTKWTVKAAFIVMSIQHNTGKMQDRYDQSAQFHSYHKMPRSAKICSWALYFLIFIFLLFFKSRSVRTADSNISEFSIRNVSRVWRVQSHHYYQNFVWLGLVLPLS